MKMRVLTFEPGNEAHRHAFNHLFSAWHFVTPDQQLPLVSVGTTPERIELAIDINKAFRDNALEIGPGRYDLAAGGAVVTLRESGLDLLKEFWARYKQMLPPTLAEQMQETDSFLKEVPVAESVAA